MFTSAAGQASSSTAASCAQAFSRWLSQNQRYAISVGPGQWSPSPVTNDGWAAFLRENPDCARFAVAPGAFRASALDAASSDACSRAYQNMLTAVPRTALLLTPGADPHMMMRSYEDGLVQSHPQCGDWLLSESGRLTADMLASAARHRSTAGPGPGPDALLPAPSPSPPPVPASTMATAVPWWLILLGGTVLGVAIARVLR